MEIEVLPVCGLEVDTFKKYMGGVYRQLEDGSFEPVHTIPDHLEEVVDGTSRFGDTLYIKASDLSPEDAFLFKNEGKLKIITVVPEMSSTQVEEFGGDEKLLPSNISGGREIYDKYSSALYEYKEGRLKPVLYIKGDSSVVLGGDEAKGKFFVLSKLPEELASILEQTYANDMILLSEVPAYMKQEADFSHGTNAI